MRLGRPITMPDQNWFGPRSRPPYSSHSTTASRIRPRDLSRGDRQCLHDLGRSHCLHHLRETPRTVGVSLKAIRRIDAMCRLIRPLRDPALAIKGRSDLVSNEPAETTDREQWRFFPQSGRGFMSDLSEQGVNTIRSVFHGSAPYSHDVRHETSPRQSHDGSPVGRSHAGGGHGAPFFMLVRLIALRVCLCLMSRLFMMLRVLLVMVNCLFCHGVLLDCSLQYADQTAYCLITIAQCGAYDLADHRALVSARRFSPKMGT